MTGRIASLAVVLLLLAGMPAQAHDITAIELARINALVNRALASDWPGLLALVAGGAALGALHGLEPGHAKTMMSAFIIAIGGTVGQAVLLGVSATVAHTAVVWALVVPLLAWGGSVDLAANAPYAEIASAVAVLGVAGWTLLRVVRGRPAIAGGADDAAAPVIETGHGLLTLRIETIGGAPHFVARGVARSGRTIPLRDAVEMETRGPDGTRATFAFAERDGAQVSRDPVLAAGVRAATLRLPHEDHDHAMTVVFDASGWARPAGDDEGGADAHERAHAEALRRRLVGGRPMTRWQIVLFGLSGGLVPCPAAVTVLLLCLQLKRIGLGLLLVTSFSCGLAVTMIAAGTVAALGARHLARRGAWFATLARPAAYASCGLIIGIATYMLAEGLRAVA